MIARKCRLETEYGKFLDPLSDKIVYFIPLFVFAFIGEVSWIFVILLFFLDGFSQFSRVFIKKVSKKQQANMFGKIKTTLIFLFIFSLLLNFHFLDYFWYFWILSLSLGSIVRKVIQ
jgi:CDP-diacylglycerol--glycerol-3-phosphate 3-phosphatidyltransferase